MSDWAIVVAAGDGTRLGASGPKALVSLAGRTLLERSIDAAGSIPKLNGMIVACGASWLAQATELVGVATARRGRVCEGGATRHQSVRAALARVPGDATRIVVHDAARPLAGAALFERCLAALNEADGAVCAVPAADTLKRCDAGGAVLETVDRTGIWRAQTPQAFRAGALRAVIENATDPGDATDEAVLLERAGHRVVVVAGDERNIKITTPEDLALAEALIR